ncbi:hypothetical protein STENM36S_05882 [Streptomyces tendae]
MFPGRTLTDLGFAPRSSVRGRQARTTSEPQGAGEPYETHDTRDTHDTQDLYETHDDNEESDVLRRAFMTSGATVAAASLGPLTLAFDAAAAGRPTRRAGTGEAGALEEAVRRIRVLDDRHGADGLYRRAAAPLRTAYALLTPARPGRPPRTGSTRAPVNWRSPSAGWRTTRGASTTPAPTTPRPWPPPG